MLKFSDSGRITPVTWLVLWLELDCNHVELGKCSHTKKSIIDSQYMTPSCNIKIFIANRYTKKEKWGKVSFSKWTPIFQNTGKLFNSCLNSNKVKVCPSVWFFTLLFRLKIYPRSLILKINSRSLILKLKPLFVN